MKNHKNPEAFREGENYLVCRKTKFGEERLVQSDRTPERADHSVSVLNEHEINNAREPRYYWRMR